MGIMYRTTPSAFSRVRTWGVLGYKRTRCSPGDSHHHQHSSPYRIHNMAATNPPIAIIGAGPAGLTLASLLTLRSIPYTLFERSAPPSPSDNSRAGGSLDIHPETGQLALKEAGLFEKFQRFARYEDTVFSVFDKTGKRVLNTGQGRDAPEIDRGELTRVLLGGVPAQRIKWEYAWSRVRELVTSATPKYSGRSYLEARINRDNPFWKTIAQKAGAGTSMTAGDKKLVITQRQGDGSYRTYFGLEVPDNFFSRESVNFEDLNATRQLLLGLFAGWADKYTDMIRHSTDFRGWPLYSLSAEAMNWKAVSGATLIGDAAHVALPNGEGVNLAMADALDLAKKIAEQGVDGLDRAVEEYEAGMFPRGAQSISEGLGMADIMFSEGPGAFVELMKSFGAGDE